MKNNILKSFLSITTAAIMAITSTTIAAAETTVSSNPSIEIDGITYYQLECSPSSVTVEAGETVEVSIVWGSNFSVPEPAYTGELPELTVDNSPSGVAEVITTDSNNTFSVKGLCAGTTVVHMKNADGFSGCLWVTVTDADATTTHAAGTTTGTTVQTTAAAAPETTTTFTAAASATTTTYSMSTTNNNLVPMTFEPAAANIVVDETLDVTMYAMFTGEEWTDDFPEITIADPEIVSVTQGDTSSILKVTGLAPGSTSIHFNVPGQGSTVFLVNVAAPEETTTAVSEAIPSTETTTTTTAAPGIMCNVSEIELEGGQRKTVGLYFTDGRDYTGALPSLEIDNPAVAAVNAADIPYNFYVTGISDGTAVITITDPIYGYTTTLNVTVTGTYVNGSNSSELDLIIHALPDKLVYSIGEELDLTGGMYSVKKYAGTEREMIIKDQVDMTQSSLPDTGAFDNTTPGTYPIVLSYSYYDGSWDIYVFHVVVREGTAETGDIDGSGGIDIADATMVLEYYACNAAGMIYETPINAETADVDRNDETAISDATHILTYYAKKAAGLECSWNEIIGG
ncbi:MAG: bacterial Ig-like domain-containing protein [Ruminococcus sp.]|nr:bacterial Ig-like domain-containing protein [Ruminococcus sp.]